MLRRVALMGVVFVLAGCGAKPAAPDVATAGGGATPSATATVSPEEQRRQYKECMAQHGVDVGDPEPGKELANIEGPKEKVTAALEKCRKYLPNGGVPPTISAQDLEKMRQYAACIREHGFPDFPDPEANGKFKMDSDLKKDAKFRTANDACQHLAPQRKDGGK